MSKKKNNIAGYFFLLAILVIFALIFYQGLYNVDKDTNMSTNQSDPNYSPYAGTHNLLSFGLQGFGNAYIIILLVLAAIGAFAALKYIFKMI